jgi:hypothetical protein
LDLALLTSFPHCKQKKGNTQSGSEMAKSKEHAAEIMRQKQAAGKT